MIEGADDCCGGGAGAGRQAWQGGIPAMGVQRAELAYLNAPENVLDEFCRALINRLHSMVDEFLMKPVPGEYHFFSMGYGTHFVKWGVVFS